ncbi:unnamed protein product [Pichia kudriavzevii]
MAFPKLIHRKKDSKERERHEEKPKFLHMLKDHVMPKGMASGTVSSSPSKSPSENKQHDAKISGNSFPSRPSARTITSTFGYFECTKTF